MERTPMQQHIAEMTRLRNMMKPDSLEWKSFNIAVLHAETLRHAEREAIEDAYHAGTFFKSVNSMRVRKQRTEEATEFFTTKYKTP